jgi:O-antigen/teichoic acid export membrane protein
VPSSAARASDDPYKGHTLVRSFKGLVASTFLMLSGNLAYALSQWVIVIIYARVFNPEAVGLFALSIAIATPLITLSQLGFRQILFSDNLEKYSFSTYFELRAILSICAILLCTPVYLALGYSGENLAVLMMFTLARGIDSILDIYQAFFHLKDKLAVGARIAIVRSLLGLALAGTTVWATGSLIVSATGFAVAAAVGLVLAGAVARKHHRAASADRSEQFSLLRLAWPAGISTTLTSLTGYVPRFVVEHVGGLRLVGQVAALEYLLALGTLAVFALGQVASKSLADKFRSGDRRGFVLGVTWAAGAALIIGVIGATGATFWGSWIVSAVYGDGYLEAAQAARSVMLGGTVGFVSLILWFSAMATGRFKGMSADTVIIFVITVGASWWAIGAYGLEGFGLALALSGVAAICVWLRRLRLILRQR